MFDLNEFCKKSFEVAKARQNNGGKIDVNTLPMLKHCATEVIEAMNAYDKLRYSTYEYYDEKDFQNFQKNFEDELADIMSCCIIIAGNEGIDLESALNRCYERNKLRSENKGDKK